MSFIFSFYVHFMQSRLEGELLIPGSDVPGFCRRIVEIDGGSIRIRKESILAVNVLDAAFPVLALMNQ